METKRTWIHRNHRGDELILEISPAGRGCLRGSIVDPVAILDGQVEDHFLALDEEEEAWVKAIHLRVTGRPIALPSDHFRAALQRLNDEDS